MSDKSGKKDKYTVEIPWFVKDILDDDRVKEWTQDEYWPIYRNGNKIIVNSP